MEISEKRIRVTVVHTTGYDDYVKVETMYPDSSLSFATYADSIEIEEVYVS